MATRISNLALRNKCAEFIRANPSSTSIDKTIESAIKTASREIVNLDTVPLAWNRERYNEMFTRAEAVVSAATAADPCVLTAASSDSGVTGHGFEDDDIAYIDGVAGMDQLNRRVVRVNAIDTTTLGLYQLDDTNSINSTNYDDYMSGGRIYHIGSLIPSSTIEPSSGAAAYLWKIKSIYGVTFDMHPATPLAEEVETFDARYIENSDRPDKWRYERYGYGRFDQDQVHYLFFRNPANSRYNIEIRIEKEYPDITTFANNVFPPHPNEIHDCIWRRALSLLSTNPERQRAESTGGERMYPQYEVIEAQFWQREVLKDEKFIKDFSRNLLGGRPGQGLGVRMNNPDSRRGGGRRRGRGRTALIP